jgi:hypothetical protein
MQVEIDIISVACYLYNTWARRLNSRKLAEKRIFTFNKPNLGILFHEIVQAPISFKYIG